MQEKLWDNDIRQDHSGDSEVEWSPPTSIKTLIGKVSIDYTKQKENYDIQTLATRVECRISEKLWLDIRQIDVVSLIEPWIFMLKLNVHAALLNKWLNDVFYVVHVHLFTKKLNNDAFKSQFPSFTKIKIKISVSQVRKKKSIRNMKFVSNWLRQRNGTETALNLKYQLSRVTNRDRILSSRSALFARY